MHVRGRGCVASTFANVIADDLIILLIGRWLWYIK